MRFSFRSIPEPGGVPARPRPILDVTVEGLQIAPQACLLDSGATAIRLGAYVAELAGIDLREAPETRLAVGGALVRARMAETGLRISDGTHGYEWDAPVWFCDPWIPAFGLLGLTGFFDHFEVTITAYQEYFELQPLASS